ncbi:TetR/AcrR family transcriptional regulator [Paraburkholderia acidisoli]|uniref:TetR family transcriptional regulator n=1 Tax=Paraburkholderia acidisoli TaxID=2571748 RepID=A0A7Z2JJG9_9BURK|nr:TetR family transcriptional regulator [Paraburkholderia acidisoli]QGZ65360.1 TetR family transcriptional regulator [Paraburkholderia acidisoli]
MTRKVPTPRRRESSLSREQIVEASIALLDASGESGLTFRALAEHLATGAGAIYWHVASKSDLLTAACDAIVARSLHATARKSAAPKPAIRALALALFDAIDTHPWVGSALTRAPGSLPMVRILERIGQQVVALGVPGAAQWTTTNALLSYILGVSGQNAANAHLAREQGFERDSFLGEVSAEWAQLDGAEFPFTRSVAAHMLAHDDRADFLAGVDLILAGIPAARRR